MKITEVIQTVLDLVPAIGASALAKESDVNKGQLSAFLKKDGPMSAEKQATLIHFLLQLLEDTKQSAEVKMKLSPLVAQLRQFTPYRVQRLEGDPYQCILYGWKRYIERDVEESILAGVEHRPFVISIASGPKTGKSSIAQRVKMDLDKVGEAIYLDCKHFSASNTTDFVEWIFQTTATQLSRNFDEHPLDWVSIVDWLKQDILSNSLKPCTFIFDHLETLGEAYVELSSGWHYVLNQTRDEPALKALGLVLVFDPASAVLYNAKNRSSRLEQRARLFVPENYSKGQVDRLLKAALAVDAKDPWDRQLTEDVWTMFRGHPFLSHVYGAAYGDSKPDDAASSASNAAEKAFHEHIVPTLLTNVYSDTLRSHFGAQLATPDSDLSALKPSKKEHSMLLHDSGLFFERGFGDNAVLHCTPWVRDRLVEAMSGGPDAQ